MITGYFGVPGCGKSSLLTKIAIKNLKQIKKGKSHYKHIVSNFPIKGITTIETTDLCKFNFFDTLIILDELTLDCDGRNYKSFDENLKDFIVLHRHLGCDIVYAVQDPSSVDKRIRDLTYDLNYISRSPLPFFRRFIRTKKIFRQININELSSELTLGYRFSKFFESLFSKCNKIYYIPTAWKYYDSFSLDKLDGRPDYFAIEPIMDKPDFFLK